MGGYIFGMDCTYPADSISVVWQTLDGVRCEFLTVFNTSLLALCGTKEAALKGADALIIVTEWKSFRAPGFDLIKQQLSHPTIFDGRNLYEPKRMNKKGFTYYSVGRSVGLTKDNDR